MSTPTFSAPFHRDSLMRTKSYVAGSLFESSFAFTKKKAANVLTEVIESPADPNISAPLDGIAIIVGIVSDSNLKVKPLGNWTRNSEKGYNKSIESAKYVFLVTCPDNDPAFAPDFPIVITQLKRLQDTVSKSKKNLWSIFEDNKKETVRFSFPVFKSKSADSEPIIDMKAWPVPTEARDAFEQIVDSHIVRDFNVWDVDGTRLDPESIPSKLPGALVECYFGIVHHSFDKDDAFSGIINQILILRVAPAQTPSPFKSNRPYRAPILSPTQVHAQEQRAVNLFTKPISAPGPSSHSSTATPTVIVPGNTIQS
ncbi:hypothetical protein C8R45DRAFT_1104055 [Mycena sanguinolenta]|nr:hypothetical protein C8R45DRAFT_1104055 [Mycena sanguinolenta]